MQFTGFVCNWFFKVFGNVLFALFVAYSWEFDLLSFETDNNFTNLYLSILALKSKNVKLWSGGGGGGGGRWGGAPG